ncbi:hypothetical protein [uncultured Nostoc sp.]|uniref:hypothetical protein n=1 Tax=uncultured Nostoc sp. TaxID=340711 RepID=UPI0035CB19B0
MIDIEKLLERYPAGERDFNGANLNDSDFTSVNLSSIDPTKSDAIACVKMEAKADEKPS